jgi:hypothetical protein
MTSWQAIPTLVGQENAIQRFARELRLSPAELRRTTWEVIPYIAPAKSPGRKGFEWEKHLYDVYKVTTPGRGIWLFWLAFENWHPGEMLNWTMPAVVHWEPAPPALRRVQLKLTPYSGKVEGVHLSHANALEWCKHLNELPVTLRDGTDGRVVGARVEGTAEFGFLVVEIEPEA